MNEQLSCQLIETLIRLIDNQSITQAIDNHALPRSYDWQILETAQNSNNIALWTIGASVVITLLTLGVSYYIYIRQEKMIEKQLEINQQQNAIALFDKRYELYRQLEMFWYGYKLLITRFSKDYLLELLHDPSVLKKTKFISHFLFNNEQTAYTRKDLSEFDKKQHYVLYIKEKVIELESLKLIFKLDGKAFNDWDEILTCISTITANAFNVLPLVPQKNGEPCPPISEENLLALDKLESFLTVLKKQVDLTN